MPLRLFQLLSTRQLLFLFFWEIIVLPFLSSLKDFSSPGCLPGDNTLATSCVSIIFQLGRMETLQAEKIEQNEAPTQINKLINKTHGHGKGKQVGYSNT